MQEETCIILSPFHKGKSPTSSHPCLTSHPFEAELCNSGSRRRCDFSTRVSDIQLTRSGNPEEQSKWQGKGLPLTAQKPRQITWTRFLPLFCSDSKNLSHIPLTLCMAAKRPLLSLAWNSSNHRIQSSHLISTEQDLCSDPMLLCVHIFLKNICKPY